MVVAKLRGLEATHQEVRQAMATIAQMYPLAGHKRDKIWLPFDFAPHNVNIIYFPVNQLSLSVDP